jgi:hypothetical protein
VRDIERPLAVFEHLLVLVRGILAPNERRSKSNR